MELYIFGSGKIINDNTGDDSKGTFTYGSSSVLNNLSTLLLTNYGAEVRPLCPGYERVNVTVDIAIRQLISLVGDIEASSELIQNSFDIGIFKLYDMLTPLDKSYLSEVKTTVRSVCGTKLELRGKGRFNLHFGPNMLQSEAVVTDLQVDGILGLDFMKRHNCLIDVKNGHFCIGDFKVDLCFRDQ
ncbi:unnamed protein product [Mytilus edulis]|uniref:Uncharacterized protein n=1 Tax=Mytilus edulis TaxID=6550 RepID=A0A8S3UGQ7_MYTED|nr:unnamed protein product [Mytilus edulis]